MEKSATGGSGAVRIGVLHEFSHEGTGGIQRGGRTRAVIQGLANNDWLVPRYERRLGVGRNGKWWAVRCPDRRPKRIQPPRNWRNPAWGELSGRTRKRRLVAVRLWLRSARETADGSHGGMIPDGRDHGPSGARGLRIRRVKACTRARPCSKAPQAADATCKSPLYGPAQRCLRSRHSVLVISYWCHICITVHYKHSRDHNVMQIWHQNDLRVPRGCSRVAKLLVSSRVAARSAVSPPGGATKVLGPFPYKIVST